MMKHYLSALVIVTAGFGNLAQGAGESNAPSKVMPSGRETPL